MLIAERKQVLAKETIIGGELEFNKHENIYRGVIENVGIEEDNISFTFSSCTLLSQDNLTWQQRDVTNYQIIADVIQYS